MHVGHGNALLQDSVELVIEHIQEELAVTEVVLGAAGNVEKAAVLLNSLVKILRDLSRDKG